MTNRFGKRLYRDLLQDLHREGLGHSLHRDPRRVGGAAHSGAVAGARRSSRRHVAQQALDARSRRLINEFQYPRLGPGPDVGDLPRPDRASMGNEVLLQHYVTADRAAATARSTAVAGETAEGERRFAATTSSRPCRSARWCARLDPAPPRAGRGRPARAWRYRDFLVVALMLERDRPLSGQLDLHPHAGREGRPHPELQQLERGDGARAGASPAWAWSTSASRATGCGTSSDADLIDARDRGARVARPGRRRGRRATAR